MLSCVRDLRGKEADGAAVVPPQRPPRRCGGRPAEEQSGPSSSHGTSANTQSKCAKPRGTTLDAQRAPRPLLERGGRGQNEKGRHPLLAGINTFPGLPPPKKKQNKSLVPMTAAGTPNGGRGPPTSVTQSPTAKPCVCFPPPQTKRDDRVVHPQHLTYPHGGGGGGSAQEARTHSPTDQHKGK